MIARVIANVSQSINQTGPWSIIILKHAGQPGQQVVVVFSNMDFTRAQLGQTNSNAKDNDQQDVSHLAFFPNSRNLIRQFCFRTFFVGSILSVWSCLVVFNKKMKTMKKQKKRLRHRPSD